MSDHHRTIATTVGQVSIAYFNDCELRFFYELARTQCIDHAGVANTQHAQIAIFKFTIYLEKPKTQLFYYAIKTQPTVYVVYIRNMYTILELDCTIMIIEAYVHVR